MNHFNVKKGRTIGVALKGVQSRSRHADQDETCQLCADKFQSPYQAFFR